MAYKSLLTIISDIEASQPSLSAAMALAEKENAHLDVFCVGVDMSQLSFHYGQVNTLMPQEMIQRAREDAEAVEQAIRQKLASVDFTWSVDSAATQIDGLSRHVSRRARFSDLVILHKPYGAGTTQSCETMVESALFDGHAPLLIIPAMAKPDQDYKRIVIAWNESAESLAAIRAALPLLRQADLVSIAVVDPPKHGPNRSDPGGALAQMLSRQGVKADIAVLAKTMPHVSDVLLRHLQDVDSDLMVMGAYGHSRFREALLGGATRDMLERCEIPVFMAH